MTDRTGRKVMLTNKSTRIYTTSQGKFYPATSKEFDEKEAFELLGYAGEIVRTTDVLGTDAQKMVEEKDKEIKELKGRELDLATQIEALNAKLRTTLPRESRVSRK